MAEDQEKTTAPVESEAPETPKPGEESTAAGAQPAAKKAKAKPEKAAKTAALEEKLATAEEKAADAHTRLLRQAAEYENFRKRSQKEQEAAFGHGVAHAAKALLPVLDVLEAAATAPTQDEDYRKGVMMTLAKAQEVFSQLGIAEIDALGQPFDPELHNACMQEAREDAESGTVTRVVQKGYSQNGRVIRHAMVAVQPE